MGRFDIKTRAGLLSSIIQGQSASPSDGDAQAFIFRVEAAGGTLTTTEKNSINTLVVRLKALSLWTNFAAIYPMVGGSAAACAQNLKSGTYTATFSGGLTFASTGVTGNGSSGYMNTGLNPSTALISGNNHISFYSRNNPTPGTSIEIGVAPPSAYEGPYMRLRLDGFGVSNTFSYDAVGIATYGAVRATNTDSSGHYIGNIVSTSNRRAYKNGLLLATLTTTIDNALSNGNIYVLANNTLGVGPEFYSSKECAFASFGDGLTDTQASNFYNAVQEFQTLLGRQIGAPAVSDADASAFIQRVYTAGGTLTTAEQNAVNQLTIDLKAANIWTGMKAVYPMVGASAAACAQNLRTGSFTGTFNGGWNFALTGVIPNGTSGYMDTGLNLNGTLNVDSVHMSFYSRTQSTTFSGGAMGVGNEGTNGTYIAPYYSGTIGKFFLSGIYPANAVGLNNTTTTGLTLGSKTATNLRKLYLNGSLLATNTAAYTYTFTNSTVYLGALNYAGANYFTGFQCAFASIGDGLTDTQATYLNNAVETFQTSLSRNVGAIIPTVSDPDATAFIARVYGAGGTLSTLECNAVNQLAISMKATGVWNSTKAVYPMVGASAAACAQNLKSDSFTGTFSGGWAYSSTGITGNGTNTYMNTTLVPSTQLSQDSAHLASYLRTTNSANHYSIGGGNSYVVNYGYAAINNIDTVAVSVLGQTGFFLNSRIMSTQIKQYKNNTTLGTFTVASQSPSAFSIYVGAGNGTVPGGFVNGQIAFASIGDGLTDTQESDYYSAVQAFQTTLSRNV